MIECISVFAFAFVTAVVWRLHAAAEASIRKHRIMRRLLVHGPGKCEGGVQSAVLSALARLGKRLLPSSELERDRLRRRLDYAGFHAVDALELYLGLRAACAVGFGTLAFLLLDSWRGFSGQTLVLSYGALMLGYYAPAWGLRWRERGRTRRVFQELPDAVDILLVCMNAGLSFDRALQRVSRELKYIAPVLAGEFERYFFEVESGLPRQKALANLAERNRVDALTSVVNVLVQSVRFGTDIAHALRVHAESLRTERKQIAEERAAKVSTKLVFPTVMFIMPALMLVVLGPTGIRLLERIRQMSW